MIINSQCWIVSFTKFYKIENTTQNHLNTFSLSLIIWKTAIETKAQEMNGGNELGAQRAWKLYFNSWVQYIINSSGQLMAANMKNIRKQKQSNKYTVSQKNWATIHSFITLTHIGRFSKFFHCCISQEICNKAHASLPTTPQQCRSTTSRNVKFKIQPFSVTAFTNHTYEINIVTFLM